MPAVNSFLRQAVAILLEHGADPNPNPKHRWSAAYLPLSKLLGEAFNHRMRAVHELERDYIYVGNHFGGPNDRKEHVVPMKCLVRRLLAMARAWQGNRSQDVEANVSQLREFLHRHLVMAHIPAALDDMLPAHEMPNDNWWHQVGGEPEFSELGKEQAIWQRYLTLEAPHLVIPYLGNDDFVQVPAGA